MMDLSKLHVAPYNPKLMPKEEFEALKNSIQTFDYVEYIVANKRTNYTIISGNSTYEALLELGWKQAEVIVVDMPLESEKALNIAMRRIGGVFDKEKLEKLIIELDESDFNIELTGLSDFEIDMAFSDAELELDPFKDEFNDDEIKFETESEKERGTPRPKKEKHEKHKKTIICPNCGMEIEA